MLKYFRNPEVKKFNIEISIIFLIFIVFNIFLMKMEIENINKNYIKQNVLMVGNVVKNHPELENEIVSSLNLKNDSNYKLGKNILDKYSYNESLEAYKNPLINKFYKDFLIKMMAAIIIFLLIIYAFICNNFICFYKKAEIFIKASEEIIEGNFKKFKSENKEGEFYILSEQFNVMSDRMSESLERLKKEKVFLKNIISDISHQLKTPLFSLIMFNDLMKNEDMPKEDRKNFLKLSEEQLKRMEWLIINLLKVGRLEAGVVEFNIRNTPLLITVNKALGGLTQKAKEKDQHIKIDIGQEVYFKHDMEWTAEAFSNIIKNCIEHTNHGGKIEISSEETPISLSVNIKDNGEGIPKELQRKIFERFYKGENSTNPCSIGIGLSLSKTIIESQNGSIRVESEVGKGTNFIIVFLKTII